MKTPRLGVNIDHIATLRNARGVNYPCPIEGAMVCEQAGADGITLHLREDRRHIKDNDVYAIKRAINIPMNLEMAVTDEMLTIAQDVRPNWVCLVPEKRQELTTEGGLDVISHKKLPNFIKDLHNAGIKVSLFVDPDNIQIAQALEIGADAIEIHTGAYAEAHLNGTKNNIAYELNRVQTAVAFALSKRSDCLVNAGHGLTVDNVASIAQIVGIYELNIGHSLIADAIFMGLEQAIKNMKLAFCDSEKYRVC